MHMPRFTHLVAWVLGAALSALAYWCVLVYIFDEFNPEYGRDTWFILNLYHFAFFMVSGLVGYFIAALFRVRPRTFAIACLPGVAFTVGQLLLVFALGRAFHDREVVGQALVGALVLGALSIFAVPSRAA
jgi:hypothetical protein